MKRGSFVQIQSQASVSPALQVTVRKGSVAFPGTSGVVQDARFVQVLIDEANRRVAFLFTRYQGEGAFALTFDGSKAKPIRVVTCAALTACEWLKPGKYEAAPDHRNLWILKAAPDSPKESEPS